MLGKLMKYEWKNTWKAGCLMLLGMLIVTSLGCVVLHMRQFARLFDDGNISGGQALGVMSVFVAILIIYVVMLLAATWGMLIYLGMRFYRSMYTDEGYLTHTLPVTTNQLFLSKVLVSGAWYLIVEVGIGVSVLALVISMMTGLFDIGGVSGLLTEYDGNFWAFLSDGIYELSRFYKEQMGINLAHYALTLLLSYVIGPFVTMITLFGALTIGQLSSRHKGLMGILAYAGLTILTTVIGSVVQSVFVFGANMANQPGNISATANVAYDINVLTSLLIVVVMYGVSYYIMNKKLNLD